MHSVWLSRILNSSVLLGGAVTHFFYCSVALHGVNMPPFVHPSVNGHLCSSSHFGAVNKADVQVFMQVYFCEHVYLSYEWTAGPSGSCKQLSRGDGTRSPPSLPVRVPLSGDLPLSVLPLFYILALLRGVVLVFIFLMTNEIEHPFHTLVSHLDIILCEVLFRYFAHLHVIGWFFFILLVYGNYLHILSRTVLSWIYVLQVYFLSLWFAFLLFEWSSNEQKFLILLKFILSVFSIIAVLFCVLFKKSVSQGLDGVLPCFLPAALLFYLSL